MYDIKVVEKYKQTFKYGSYHHAGWDIYVKESQDSDWTPIKKEEMFIKYGEDHE
jgi:phage terminase large subunit-like protein